MVQPYRKILYIRKILYCYDAFIGSKLELWIKYLYDSAYYYYLMAQYTHASDVYLMYKVKKVKKVFKPISGTSHSLSCLLIDNLQNTT